MALIKHMLGRRAISGFRGTLDFYYYMGLAVCRTWPKSPGHNRNPEVMSTWEAFSIAARMWNEISPSVRRAYEHLATGTGLSGKDLAARAYMKGLYREPIP